MQELYQNSQLQFKEVKELISEQNSHIQLIWEGLNTLISEMSALGEHVRKYSDLRALPHGSEIRTYRLKFENKCCADKYSRHDMKADDGSPIEVAIYDNENRIITNGPLSSIQVKIVVLDGEFNKENKEQWGENSFNTSIVRGRPGKQPLFANELYLRLENGVANLCGAKFQDNSSFVPSKKFRLGVMAADDNISEKILEGISESFAVKDGRGYRKFLSIFHYNTKKHKLLVQNHINLVQDFLWSYNKDKDSLRQACGNITDHDWDIIVRHALSCKPGHELYSHCIPGTGATILFNSLYSIVGAEFNGVYTSCEEFNNTQKKHMYTTIPHWHAPYTYMHHVNIFLCICQKLVEESKAKAYDNLEVVQSENKNPCHEHELIIGDKGSCYMGGSCSTPPVSTQPTRLYGQHLDHSRYLGLFLLFQFICVELSHQDQGEVSESGQAQESPRRHQRWVKVVTVVTAIRFWNKELAWSIVKEMISTP
ncbi:Calmodulin-binding protein 60 F [Dichanthelium oligosanthes]|uniref:Calmodulin-binding protein 60 F n=1 Tax=Dichanthelium oligosanthes TaxID=888268 RepID=A0A1E5VXI8_9POAL|nr:Calmodulin-binding protein 60 F [Dichanthelium oligosanthes]